MTGLLVLCAVAILAFLFTNHGRLSKLEDEVAQLKSMSRVVTGATPVQAPVVTPTVAPVSPLPLAQQAPAVLTQTPIQSPAPSTPEKKSTEFTIGSSWFLGAGGIAVLIGVGFFFRYAFENNLISEPLRIALGVIIGLLVVGLGSWLTKKYRTYGLGLVGIGLGIVYISIYSGYVFFALIPAVLCFALLVGVVLLGMGLSLYLDAKQLCAFALVGGYVSIMLFAGTLSLPVAFASLLLLAGLVIGVSYKKKWPELVTLGFVSTFLALAAWKGAEAAPLIQVIPLVSVLFATYALSTLLNFAKTNDTYTSWQTFNAYSVPVSYVLYISMLLEDVKQVALLSFGVALFYAFLALIIRAGAKEHLALKKFAHVALFLVPTFLAFGTALYFEGAVQVYLLLLESVLVIGCALYFNSKLQYYFGQFLLGVGLLSALVHAVTVYGATSPILFNESTLVLLSGTVVALVVWKLHFIRKDSTVPGKDSFRILDAVALYGMTFSVGVAETIKFQMESVDEIALFFITLGVVSVFMFLLGVIEREKTLRVLAVVSLMLTSVFVVMMNLLTNTTVPFFNIYMLGLLIVAVLGGSMAFVGSRAKEEGDIREWKSVRKAVLIIVNVTALTVLSMDIHRFFTAYLESAEYLERITISLFWLLYAVGALVLGIAKRSTFARQLAMALFVLAGLKVFLFDSLQLNDIYRFVSFISLGIILLVVGYLYYRFKDRIRTFVGIEEK